MKVELRAVLPSTGLPGVLDQGESEVDGRVLLDLRRHFPHVPSDGVDGWAIEFGVADGDFEVSSLVANGSRWTHGNHVTQDEDRRGVPWPEGFQLLQFFERFEGQFRNVNLAVASDDGLRMRAVELGFNGIIQPFLERVEFGKFEAKARRHRVAAELKQKVFARFKGFVDVHTVD